MENYDHQSVEKLIDILPHGASPYILIVKMHLNAELGSLEQFRSAYNETEQVLGEEATKTICELLIAKQVKNKNKLTKHHPEAERMFFPSEELDND